jgi:hypothetical protein
LTRPEMIERTLWYEAITLRLMQSPPSGDG